MDWLELELSIEYDQHKRRKRYNKTNIQRRTKRLQKQEQIYPDLLMSTQGKQNERAETARSNTVDFHNNIFIDHYEDEQQDFIHLNEYTLQNDNENHDEIIGNLSFHIYDDSEDNEQALSCDDGSNEASALPLHHYTCNTTLDYCEKFMIIARQSHISKIHTNSFLSLIKSGLPVPNTIPSTEKQSRDLLGVQELFTKRSVCLLCSLDFDYKQITCPRCSTSNKTRVAFVYDGDIEVIIKNVMLRLYSNIDEYKVKIKANDDVDKTRDIPFGSINVMNKNHKLIIFGVTGDCPAISLICNFINHNGYYCCWFCFIKGEHIGHKRQYRYSSLILRTAEQYSKGSKKAERKKNNIYGHLGKTMLDDILDLPLPNAVVIDYLHVTLLGHAKAIILSIYRQLKPIQREQLNIQLRNQKFPHFFNRKIRSMDNFAFVKGTEVRNLLFYGLLPHMNLLLPSEQYAHLALYVIAIRLLHSGHIFGNKTNEIADRLFSRFYVDHELFYDQLQPFKLHLHAHYSYMYETHGSLCNLGCFGQESFIGAISSEHHGTRYYGDSITYYYNIDLCIQRKKIRKATIDGPYDLSSTTPNDYDYMNRIHSSLCMCTDLSSCCLIYRRFIMKNETFHSLIYNRRQTSVSYFVQYSLANGAIEYRFGIIELFFVCNSVNYAIIKHHRIKELCMSTMTNNDSQIVKKRAIKPKTQYSPSNPTTATTYHLTFDNDTKQMMIVGHSSIKRFVNDNKAVLNDGHTAKIIASGTKEKCMEYWKNHTFSSINNSGESDDENDIVPDLMKQTLQMPSNTFLTPAPIRRKRALINRSNSPDSIFSVSSPKRPNQENRPSTLTARTFDDPSFFRTQRRVTTVSSPISSDDEEVIDGGEEVSLRRIYQELQNTQEHLRDTRSENRDTHHQLKKLTEKINKFQSLFSSKNNEDLERYRDPDGKENFRDTIPFDGRDLLEVPARNAAEYARKLLQEMFKPDELESSLLPSPHAKRFSKVELDQNRFNLLNDAVRTRYRISKHHYISFYKDRIQDSLANCLYNVGIRKKRKQKIQQQKDQQASQQLNIQQQSQIGTTLTNVNR
ncbi:unnamed protein product [Rotaria magnacalcarata]|uniref:Uncharacterized protein n=4 Tax=Rotaria magnacalcarata TaxID=392030 RepID=A0A816GM87_9BILA|nr:unnamed protein product [Rotaria magnacalcarata]